MDNLREGDVLVFKPRANYFVAEAGAKAIFKRYDEDYIEIEWIVNELSNGQMNGGYEKEDFEVFEYNIQVGDYVKTNELFMRDLGITDVYVGTIQQKIFNGFLGNFVRVRDKYQTSGFINKTHLIRIKSLDIFETLEEKFKKLQLKLSKVKKAGITKFWEGLCVKQY